MPDAPSISGNRRTAGQHRVAGPGRLLVLTIAVVMTVVACDPGGEIADLASAAPSTPPDAMTAATLPPIAAADEGGDLCASVASVEERLAALRAVELRLPNRVSLDIELAKLQAAYGELRQADLGPFESQLEGPLQRLGYRLTELELAVEDFRTNSRPARAVPHVEEDADTFAGELAAFVVLTRC